MAKPILAIDQGTTSSRAILFAADGSPQHSAQQEFAQHFPADGWVEHDGEDIWQSTLSVCREVLDKAGISASDVAGIGITNQRETTLLWDAETGELLHRAIVWQDRRTAEFCARLKADGHEALISERTGLLIDPYFSATKLRWLLDEVPDARARAERGELRFGTIDCFLLWRLTGGQVHRTDATNASRTMLFNIHTQQWDEELLQLLDIPASLLPEVMDSAADFGQTDASVLGASVPVCGIAGDQQAALIGQACFSPGMVKSTYGTGCFMVMNTGDTPIRSQNRLLTTVGYRLKGQTTYALEGSIFVAGAAIQWLRDGLELFEDVAQTEALATAVPDSGGVYVVPAFVGLGAPHWDPYARGTIVGLTRDTNRNHLVRAALEAIAFQSAEVLRSMASDTGQSLHILRIDGGASANNFLCQFQADLLGLPVTRPQVIETTARGAAFLAGLATGVWQDQDQIQTLWQEDRTFTPQLERNVADARLAEWSRAVERAKGWIPSTSV